MGRFLYRAYRRAKVWLLVRRPPLITYAFFAILTCADEMRARGKDRKSDVRRRQMEKQLYFTKFSRRQPPFTLQTEGAVALDSADHQWPRGALYDNSTSPRFNRKLYAMLNYRPDLAVLDMGCSGGGFVKSVLDDGFTAVGLEGSDVCKRLQRAEWSTIPLHLFTCDITRPFSLWNDRNQRVLFDVITAWEVLEHIAPDLVPVVIANIHDNLKPGGFFIGSIDMTPDGNPNLGVVYHLTLEGQDWWAERFLEKGFSPVTNHPFLTEDWLRGNGQGWDNWSPADGEGFHLVVRKNIT
jgi:2-polyprenyl-3-methyl-5-hydroxy-6-metoxy-1,4-benzoquinol methylase